MILCHFICQNTKRFYDSGNNLLILFATDMVYFSLHFGHLTRIFANDSRLSKSALQLGFAVTIKSLSIKGLMLFAVKKVGKFPSPREDGVEPPIALANPRCDNTLVPSSRTAHGISMSPILSVPAYIAF